MKRFATIVAVATAAALSACASDPPAQLVFKRVGPPVADHQFGVDRTVCRGNAQAQSAGIPPPNPVKRQGIGLSAAMASVAHTDMVNETYSAVYFGCMADRGWIATRQ